MVINIINKIDSHLREVSKDNIQYIAKYHNNRKILNNWLELKDIYNICNELAVGPIIKEFIDISISSGIVIMEKGNKQFKGGEKNKEVEKIIKILHGNYMIHGDLHPGNIILRSNGSAFLIDFDTTINIYTSRTELIRFVLSSYKTSTITSTFNYECEHYHQL